jgi:putative hydrolase of the HAD superfamily
MSIDIVLFDLGGVLIELGGMGDMAVLSRGASDDEIWERWLACPWVRRFERGHCDVESFARGMVESWEMPTDPDRFIEVFAAWPRGLLPGAQELVRSAARKLRVACLSNTNAVHAERHWKDLAIPELFDDLFFSHEMGLVKPDRDAFAHVVERLECRADRILFLDDNQINVDGARAAGLRAERSVGVEGAREALVDYGILPAR